MNTQYNIHIGPNSAKHEYPNLVKPYLSHPSKWHPDCHCHKGKYPCTSTWCYHHGQYQRIERAKAAHIHPADVDAIATHYTLRINAYVLPDQALQAIRHFVKLITPPRRKRGLRSYLWTVEFHDFVPHFHLLVLGDKKHDLKHDDYLVKRHPVHDPSKHDAKGNDHLVKRHPVHDHSKALHVTAHEAWSKALQFIGHPMPESTRVGVDIVPLDRVNYLLDYIHKTDWRYKLDMLPPKYRGWRFGYRHPLWPSMGPINPSELP